MKPRPRILPLAWLLICFLAQGGLHFYLPLAQLLASPLHWSGIVPLLCGIVIMVSGAGAFRRQDTPLIPFETSTALVTSGPFKFTRNPMYLGMVLILTGIAMLFGSVTPILAVVIFFFIIRAQYVIPEEIMMVELFGDEYRHYCSRVRRWV